MKIKGGGTKKAGRNKDTCAKYKQEHKKEKNKIRKWKKLIKKLSPDNDMRIQLEKRIKEKKREFVLQHKAELAMPKED